MGKNYLRKAQVAKRYGNTTPRNVDRMSNDGRLPPPIYPFENGIPYWIEEELDERDREAVLRAVRIPPRGVASDPTLRHVHRGKPEQQAEK